MDIFTQKKHFVWTISLLIILNAATLATLWYQTSVRPAQRPSRPPQGPEAVTRMIDRELNLSDVQRETLNKLRREHSEEGWKIQSSILEAKRQILEEVSHAKPDTTRIDSLARFVGNRQGLFERYLFEHFRALRAMLTPEQQKKYDALMQKVVEVAGPPNRRPPGPEGDRLSPGPPEGPPPGDRPNEEPQ